MIDLPDGPVWLDSLDVSDTVLDPLKPPGANEFGVPYVGVRLLVRIHGIPLGEVTLPLEDGVVHRERLQRAINGRFAAELRTHIEDDARLRDVTRIDAAPSRRAGESEDLPEPCTWQARLERLGAATPLVSVVLATCRRPERLARTLRTLSLQDYPELEIIVVDNAPSTPGAEAAVESVGDPRIRLLTEPVPGASRARNVGLRAARGMYVALTDDDVDADPSWVGNLVVGLIEDPRTACVTGLILPLTLDTETQRNFEQFGGFSKGYAPRVFALTDTDHGPLFPYTAGMFGSGASCAFRRDVLLGLGGLDVDLGPATAARGGEDLDAYLSVLHAGHRLRYEPAAVVRHDYRPGPHELARQMFSYGLGMSAMITKRAMASHAERRAVIRALPKALVYVLASDSPKNAQKDAHYPWALTAREIAGILCGPPAYLVSRRRARARSLRARASVVNAVVREDGPRAGAT